MNTKISGIFSVLCSALILAITLIPTRYLGTQNVGAFTEIFIRYLIPALCLMSFSMKEILSCPRDTIIKALITGAFLWIALVFAIYGIRLIEYGSMGLLLVTLYILIVPLIITVINRKLPSPLLIVCAIFCFAGLSLLIIGKPLGTPNIGTLLCILTSVFYAIYLILSGKILEKSTSPFTLHFYQSIALIVLSLPGMLFIEEQSLFSALHTSAQPLYIILSLGFIGFFSGFITYQCLFYGQRHLSPTLVVIVLSTKNIFGALLDIFLFNVPMTWIQYLAYGIVIIATTVASIAPSQTK